MADNVSITQGSGTTIATEDVSGIQHQKVKIEFGGDGVATMVSAADPLPVSATIDTTGLATTTTDTNTTTIAGDTTSIDAKIPALGQALAAASTPVVLTAAQITTLTPPAAITGFATSAKQDTIIGHVDGVETLLGTIDSKLGGTLTVTGGGGGVEYTEDAAAAADPVGGALIMVRDDALSGQTTTDGDNVAARGTDKGELYVKHVDAIPVTDNGGALTVDGTVAVTNAGITTIAGAVAGTEMQVDVLTMPTTTVQATNLDIRDLTNTDVVTAELSAVDNAVLDTIAAKDFATQTTLAAMNAKMVTGTDIGDVTINNSTGAAAVNIQDGGNTITVDGTVTANLAAGTNNIGDVDVLSIAAGDNNIGNVDIVSGTITTVSTVTSVTAIANALPAGTNAIGKLAANSGVDIGDVDVTSIVLPRSMIGPGQPGTAIDSYTHAAISAVTGSNQSLVAAPGANKQIWVYGIGFTCSVQGTVAIQDEDDTAITGVVSYAQYSGPLVHPSGNFSMPLWKVATNKALEADVTTATINGWIDYAIVSV